MTRISRIVLSSSLFFTSLVWLSIVDPNVPLRALLEDYFGARPGAAALTAGAALIAALLGAAALVEAASALLSRAWRISSTESAHGKPSAGVFDAALARMGLHSRPSRRRLALSCVLSLIVAHALGLFIQLRFGDRWPEMYEFGATRGWEWWSRCLVLWWLPVGALVLFFLYLLGRAPIRGVSSRSALIAYLCFLIAIVAFALTASRGDYDRIYYRTIQRLNANLGEKLELMRFEARSAENARDFERAALLYQRALDKNPSSQRRHKFFAESQECRLGLGRSFSALGRNRRAIAIAEQAVALEPEFWKAHRGLAMALLAAGEDDGFVQSIENALRLNPIDLYSVEVLTDFMMDAARPQDCLAAYDRYLAAYQLVEIVCNLNGESSSWQIVADGSWNRLELALPKKDGAADPGRYTLRIEARLGKSALFVWATPPGFSSATRMTGIWQRLEEPQRPSIGPLLAGGQGERLIELSGPIGVGARFIDLEYIVAKPWTETMHNKYRKALVGTPHGAAPDRLFSPTSERQ